MNKNDIISTVSIDFGLSQEQAEKAVNNIFSAIALTLKKNGNFEIKKFGKFKVTSDKDKIQKSASVKFIPSRKLSQRVNSNFENLKKIKLKKEVIVLKERAVEMNLNDELKKTEVIIKPTVEKSKKVKIEYGKSAVEMNPNDDFKKTEEVIKAPEKKMQKEKTSEDSLPGQRKLISEDLIKLHKEITEEENTEKKNSDKSSDSNLWG